MLPLLQLQVGGQFTSTDALCCMYNPWQCSSWQCCLQSENSLLCPCGIFDHMPNLSVVEIKYCKSFQLCLEEMLLVYLTMKQAFQDDRPCHYKDWSGHQRPMVLLPPNNQAYMTSDQDKIQLNEILLTWLWISGVVFPYQSRHGRYKFNFGQAKAECKDQDAILATYKQLYKGDTHFTHTTAMLAMYVIIKE